MNLLEKLKKLNIIKIDGKTNSNAKKMFKTLPEIWQEIKNHTNFLPNDRKFELAERIYLIKNNLSEIPKCKNCENIAIFSRTTIGYKSFCSKKCGYENPQRYENISKTLKKKYGSGHVFQSKILYKKFKTTMKKRYGVEYAMHSEKLKNRFFNNNLKKYGVKNTAYVPFVIEKRKETIKRKYGVDHYSKSSNYNEKVRKSNILKYDRVSSQQVHISVDSLTKLNNKDWLYEQHIKNKRFLENIAQELGVDGSTVGNYCRKFNISIKKYKESQEERDVLEFIKNNYVGEILSSNRTIIQPYELDIYIPDKSIAIEYCGIFWHSDEFKNKKYHRMKYELCKQKGIRLIQIFSDEWIENKELVKKKLLNILGISQERKIFAEKCEIKILTQLEKKEFFNKTHIQWDGLSSCNYGLYYNNELCGAIGFIKQQNDEYILNRYSTSANVVGGFTKLLTYFEKTMLPSKITTFADLRWSQGNLYEKSGFFLDKILKPDYSYIQSNSNKRINKFKIKKQRLKNYDFDLIEKENIQNNKYNRIWDCGKLKFIKDYK